MRSKPIFNFPTVFAFAFAVASATTFGSGFDLGQAGGYSAFIMPGGAINLTINGGAAIVGDAGVSANSHLDLGSGAKVGPMTGTGQVVDGFIFLDPNGATVKLDNQDPNAVHTRDLSQAVQDAIAANQAAAALPATQTFASGLDVSNNFTITGNGGVNVIDTSFIKLHGAGLLTLQGSPSDIFIFNITDYYTQSSTSNVVLAGGVSPFNVLWNFVGSGNGANLAASGQTNVGIFLSPYRDFSITDETLTGEVISGGHLAIGSKALIVPEIPTTNALLIGFGFLAGAWQLRSLFRRRLPTTR
jgi:hypothetical protein